MIKDLLCLMSQCSGFNAWKRRGLRNRLLTVCYHNALPDAAIGDTFVYRNTIGLDRLQQQLTILSRYFTFVSPQDVLAATAGTELPAGAVLVTFDDGYANMLEHAAPLLSQMGVPALFHVCTGAAGQIDPLWYEDLAWILAGWQGDHLPLPDGTVVATGGASLRGASWWQQTLQRLNCVCKTMPDIERRAYLDRLRDLPWREPAPAERAAFRKLSWEEVRRLHGRGFAIGSHTVSHPILSRLEPAALDRELADSKRRIEAELATDCPWIAYPNGGPNDISPGVITSAWRAGYRVGFTTTSSFSAPQNQPLAIGRWCAPARVSDTTFRALCSGVRLRREATSTVA